MENYNLSDRFENLGDRYHFMACGCSTCQASASHSEIEINSEGSINTAHNESRENDQRDYMDLVMDQQTLQNNIGLSEGVEYSLYYGPWEYTKISNHRDDAVKVMRHTSEQSEFISFAFERLDELIDLDFEQVDSDQVGDIRIFRAYDNSSWGERFSDLSSVGGGTAYWQSEGIDIEWRDVYSNDDFYDFEKSTIIHEIGHALGLSHPGGVGDNPGWDEWDSIMSYNDRPGIQEEPIWFSALDIQALQSIWGVEANDSPMLTGNKAVLANGSEDTQYTFSKSALLQGFTDVDSATLSVSSVQTSAGALNDNGNGTFTITPPKDFYGKVSLSYGVSDGMGGSVASSNSIYFEDMPDGIIRQGTRNRDILKGSNGDDTLLGYGGTDKLLGQKGNDIIDAGFYGKKPDVVRGGSGSDTFVLKEGYWTSIKDFKINEDILDLTGLTNGLSWDHQDGKTYIWGNDYAVAQFSGYINLDNANLV